jgi:hypothetical protein
VLIDAIVEYNEKVLLVSCIFAELPLKFLHLLSAPVHKSLEHIAVEFFVNIRVWYMSSPKAVEARG